MPDQLATTMADNIGKDGPALSATSDMPATPAAADPTPAQAALELETQTSAETKAETADATDTTTTTEGEKEGDKTPPWMKREITIERNKRREAETKAAEATARLDEALKALQTRTGQDPSTTRKALDAKDPRPAREQFESPDQYDEALIEWSARAAASAVRAEDHAKRVQEEAQQTVTKIQKDWEGRRAQALKDLPDFTEVAENPDVQISLPMANAIVTAPNGPQIAYHLGKNPELAARIAALPPGQAVFEMGLLAAQLQTKKAPEISNAPEPIKPLGSRADATSKTPSEESMEEYAARRTRELRAKPH